MHTKCIFAILLGVLITAVVSYVLFKQTEVPDNSRQYESETYSSIELGIELDYPSNLSITFDPKSLYTQEEHMTNEVGGVVVDQILFLRTKENYNKYFNLSLEGHDIREVEDKELFGNIQVQGNTVEFKKYIFGDGSPSNNCLWSDNLVSYIAELGNNIVAEIKAEEGTSCDSEKEYKYQTDPKRIEQAIKIIKTVRKI